MKLRVVVLGAGFGGLELASVLSERLGDRLDLKLIDKNDSFFFGFSKLDVMFGRSASGKVKYQYKNISKPGVRFLQENIIAIDPVKKKVVTDAGTHKADVIVIALGADYDLDITPGLEDGGNEFYSFDGALEIGKILPTLEKGDVIVGACSMPFKCPPAPSEAALLLHDYLSDKGIRQHFNISLIVPFELPIPPSYRTSLALLKAFEERGITYFPEMMVESLNPGKKTANLYDGSELAYDLFMGIPEHCVPRVVEESGLIKDDWIPVERKSLKTRFNGVYAIGDVTSVGTAKAGMFAESAAVVAAESIISEFSDKDYLGEFDGKGACYIEFGNGKVGKADVDFFSGPVPKGKHHKETRELAREKAEYFQIRHKRWFG